MDVLVDEYALLQRVKAHNVDLALIVNIFRRPHSVVEQRMNPVNDKVPNGAPFVGYELILRPITAGNPVEQRFRLGQATDVDLTALAFGPCDDLKSSDS